MATPFIGRRRLRWGTVGTEATDPLPGDELVSRPKWSYTLGIGIDENTAIVVQGDEFEVIGESYVLIYDNQKMTGDTGRFYFIPPGGRYNLQTREATRGGQNPRPIEGPRPQSWPRGG